MSNATMPRPIHALLCSTILVVAIGMIAPLFADQSIETETARPLPKGVWDFGVAFEYQTSTDGKEYTVPLAVEYGLLSGTEILVEPVPYTRIATRGAPAATGLGDTEITVTQLVIGEAGWRPALAAAGEVKLPTARSRQIGTRETDWTLYAVASKRFGPVDVHANVGYTILGSPKGQHLSNIFDFALAAETPIAGRWFAFAEVLNTTSSGSGGGDRAGATTPEAVGADTSGTVGVKCALGHGAIGFVGVVYDNNNATLVRIGLDLIR